LSAVYDTTLDWLSVFGSTALPSVPRPELGSAAHPFSFAGILAKIPRPKLTSWAAEKI
jgi:hypothetical protein